MVWNQISVVFLYFLEKGNNSTVSLRVHFAFREIDGPEKDQMFKVSREVYVLLNSFSSNSSC